MKKIIFTICFAVISLAMYSAQSMVNPWTDCGENINCGAQKAGFNFPLDVKNYTVRAMKGMLEIRFPLDDRRIVIARKAITVKANVDENGYKDISGDYNEYPVNKTVILDNGVKFSVRGEENNYKVISFAAGTGYYSIMCAEGLTKEDIEYFYKLLAAAEAPKYNED